MCARTCTCVPVRCVAGGGSLDNVLSQSSELEHHESRTSRLSGGREAETMEGEASHQTAHLSKDVGVAPPPGPHGPDGPTPHVTHHNAHMADVRRSSCTCAIAPLTGRLALPVHAQGRIDLTALSVCPFLLDRALPSQCARARERGRARDEGERGISPRRQQHLHLRERES